MIKSSGISNGQFTIVNLTEQLGELLVNVSPEKRALGISVLSQVLETIPKDTLTSEQLHFICTFYADRLKDNHQVCNVNKELAICSNSFCFW